jgi:hypothetical protein
MYPLCPCYLRSGCSRYVNAINDWRFLPWYRVLDPKLSPPRIRNLSIVEGITCTYYPPRTLNIRPNPKIFGASPLSSLSFVSMDSNEITPLLASTPEDTSVQNLFNDGPFQVSHRSLGELVRLMKRLETRHRAQVDGTTPPDRSNRLTRQDTPLDPAPLLPPLPFPIAAPRPSLNAQPDSSWFPNERTVERRSSFSAITLHTHGSPELVATTTNSGRDPTPNVSPLLIPLIRRAPKRTSRPRSKTNNSELAFWAKHAHFIVSASQNNECPICWRTYNSSDHRPVEIVGITGCKNHLFGQLCLKEWFNSLHGKDKTCPICRTILFPNTSAPVSGAEVERETHQRPHFRLPARTEAEEQAQSTVVNLSAWSLEETEESSESSRSGRGMWPRLRAWWTRTIGRRSSVEVVYA